MNARDAKILALEIAASLVEDRADQAPTFRELDALADRVRVRHALDDLAKQLRNRAARLHMARRQPKRPPR